MRNLSCRRGGALPRLRRRLLLLDMLARGSYRPRSRKGGTGAYVGKSHGFEEGNIKEMTYINMLRCTCTCVDKFGATSNRSICKLFSLLLVTYLLQNQCRYDQRGNRFKTENTSRYKCAGGCIATSITTYKHEKKKKRKSHPRARRQSKQLFTPYNPYPPKPPGPPS